MSSHACHFGATALLAMCLVATAGAQQAPAPGRATPAPQASAVNTPTLELSGGYQLFHAPDQTYPFGLSIDAARHFGTLGLVGELGWAHDSENLGGGIGDISANVWHYGVGGRWTGFRPGRVWPFAQLLLGGQTFRVRTDVGGVDISDSATSFMVQPGVGVNVVAGEGWGVVGQIDYRRTFFDEEVNADSIDNQFRVFVGARLMLE